MWYSCVYETIEKVQHSGMPVKTSQNTIWRLNVWGAWARERSTFSDEEKHPLLEEFDSMMIDTIIFWLPRFTLEVQKENEDFYPPNSLHGLCCGLQRSLRDKDIDLNIFSDSQLNKLQRLVNSKESQQISLLKRWKTSCEGESSWWPHPSL